MGGHQASPPSFPGAGLFCFVVVHFSPRLGNLQLWDILFKSTEINVGLIEVDWTGQMVVASGPSLLHIIHVGAVLALLGSAALRCLGWASIVSYRIWQLFDLLMTASGEWRVIPCLDTHSISR